MEDREKNVLLRMAGTMIDGTIILVNRLAANSDRSESASFFYFEKIPKFQHFSSDFFASIF